MSRTASIADRMNRIREKRGETPEDHEYENASRSRRTMPVPLDDIAVEDRLRAVDPAAVEHLAESIDRQGLQSPVLVRRADEGGYILVAGAHRIAAARLLGWTRIEAFEVKDLPEDELALLEIDENLYRAELDPFDRMRFLGKRKEIYQRLYPETRRGAAPNPLNSQDNGKRQTLAFSTSDERPKSFADHTAASTPFAPSTINRAVYIAEHIIPDLQDAIAATPIRKREGDLYRVACMDADEQQQLLTRLRGAEELPASLSVLQKNPATAAPRPGNVEGLKKLWTRSTEDERAEFQEWLGQLGGA
ncbi:MAG: hypothetical protein F4Y03_10760 [Alphaproteobacteria bacterium]|nr:hypothetical protein [Alphaproteobacteria bacterium]